MERAEVSGQMNSALRICDCNRLTNRRDSEYPLSGLGLLFTQIGDVGLEHIKGLTSLRRLNLLGTQVTDAGLEHLEGFTRLEWLRRRNKNTKTQLAG